MVKHTFQIEIYLGGEFQGTNSLETEIEEVYEEAFQEAETKIKDFENEIEFAGLYEEVYEKVVEEEQKNYIEKEFPYNKRWTFEEYTFKVLST